MSTGNGRVRDEGLLAINAAFEGARYLEDEAKRAAELMKIGKHRELEISDGQAMELYAIVTEGNRCEIERLNSKGEGYRASISSYKELADFFAGELMAEAVTEPDRESV